MDAKLYSVTGAEAGVVTLNPDIFGIEPNNHAVYQAVRMQQTNSRQGTAKAKERSEVRGGGKKPWRQKGRGTARAGSTRSPLWVGGGTIFGPRPRHYRMRLPEKMRQLARKSALALKARDEQVMIIEDFSVSEAKTRAMYDILKSLKIHDVKTTLLLPKYDKTLWLAGRNIPTLKVVEAEKASTYDLLNNQLLLIPKSALAVIDHLFASA